MNELQLIQSKIYEIRGQKVMIDKDLAELYQVETRRLNEAVKRNIKRFPSDFMFQLTSEEFEILKSQFAISSWGGTRKLPFAFTEQGLAMLSGVLNSDIAIQVNINIMRAFVAIRQLIANPPIDHSVQLKSFYCKMAEGFVLNFNTTGIIKRMPTKNNNLLTHWDYKREVLMPSKKFNLVKMDNYENDQQNQRFASRKN